MICCSRLCREQRTHSAYQSLVSGAMFSLMFQPDIDIMFIQALIAFIAMPGVVAFLLPALISGLEPWPSGATLVGTVPLVLGVGGLLLCVREFYVRGRGTLAPWSPPRQLVTSGLYRFSRNPMYVSVVLMLLGWACLFQGAALWIYAIGITIAFHLRVVAGEEPWLARAHGEDWVSYSARVPRWFGLPSRRVPFDW